MDIKVYETYVADNGDVFVRHNLLELPESDYEIVITNNKKYIEVVSDLANQMIANDNFIKVISKKVPFDFLGKQMVTESYINEHDGFIGDKYIHVTEKFDWSNDLLLILNKEKIANGMKVLKNVQEKVSTDDYFRRQMEEYFEED